jgi:hypothetical protein
MDKNVESDDALSKIVRAGNVAFDALQKAGFEVDSLSIDGHETSFTVTLASDVPDVKENA